MQKQINVTRHLHRNTVSPSPNMTERAWLVQIYCKVLHQLHQRSAEDANHKSQV